MLFTDVIATLFTQVLQVSSTRPELGASALSGRAASGASVISGRAASGASAISGRVMPSYFFLLTFHSKR